MSTTKGYEISFGDSRIQLSGHQMELMAVHILKLSDLFSITVGGIMKDKTHCTLCFAYDLKEGDEVTIERKEIEQTSPLAPMPKWYVPGKEPPDEANRQYLLAFYKDIEATLKGKGLI